MFDKFLSFLNWDRKNFYFFLILAVIFFLSQLYVSDIINDKIDSLQRVMDVEVRFVPQFQKSPSQDGVPFKIINTGEVTLHDVSVKIKTCKMEDYEKYPTPIRTIPFILPYKEEILHFINPETLRHFKIADCNFQKQASFSIPTKELIKINETFKMGEYWDCDTDCVYEVFLYSRELNKTFKDVFPIPTKKEMTIKPA